MNRIYVGMSGGVDSSLTAALLVEQGYDVTGVYMKNWTQDLPGMQCPWAEDLADAKRVAVQLGIPFKVYDFQAEYKQKVVDYMIEEYSAGRTPNPDIMCNERVKFKLFLETALADGAEMIATGHYARVRHGTDDSDASSDADSFGANYHSVLPHSAGKAESLSDNASKSSAGAVMMRAVDTNKDQTYFLYRVTSNALSKTLFPLGEFTKPEVRKMAEERGLLTATRRESMGICFVGSVGIREFLSEFVETAPGKIIDRDNSEVVGNHDGAIFYTLGQRHGLNLGGGLPYYVVGKDMHKNEVYVSRNLNNESMWRHELPLTDIHWINDAPHENDQLAVRLRHRGKLVPVSALRNDFQGWTLEIIEPERAVASGQSAVIYQGEEVLGGGIVA